jgi:hypothetical protein
MVTMRMIDDHRKKANWHLEASQQAEYNSQVYRERRQQYVFHAATVAALLKLYHAQIDRVAQVAIEMTQ